jgi:hypothetical protein
MDLTKYEALFNTSDVDRVCLRLRRVAKRRSQRTYKGIADSVGLPFRTSADRNRFFMILGAVSYAEYKAGRPMLSVVVVRKSDRKQGDGFYIIPYALGLLPTDATDEQKQAFADAQLAAAHEHWSKAVG